MKEICLKSGFRIRKLLLDPMFKTVSLWKMQNIFNEYYYENVRQFWIQEGLSPDRVFQGKLDSDNRLDPKPWIQ